MEAKQLKAELMKEMEAEIDQLVESYKHSGAQFAAAAEGA